MNVSTNSSSVHRRVLACVQTPGYCRAPGTGQAALAASRTSDCPPEQSKHKDRTDWTNKMQEQD